MKFNSLLKFASWSVCMRYHGIRYTLPIMCLQGIRDALDLFALVYCWVSFIWTFFVHFFCVQDIGGAPEGLHWQTAPKAAILVWFFCFGHTDTKLQWCSDWHDLHFTLSNHCYCNYQTNINVSSLYQVVSLQMVSQWSEIVHLNKCQNMFIQSKKLQEWSRTRINNIG